jgi:putative hydrolase of the HAD superfamily
LEVLRKLKENGLKVGIITNTLQTDVEKVLSKLGLPDFFDLVVSVDMAGKAKPAKEIFMYAAKRLKLKPQEMLFVGDDLEIDYEGAKKAGFKALIVDRETKVTQNVEKIKNLKEILRLLSF